MRVCIITISLLLGACTGLQWVNRDHPERDFEQDMRDCMFAISPWPEAKPWSDRLAECNAAKGWKREPKP